MECAVRDQYGPEEDTADAALDWTFRHLRHSPDHLTYRQRVTLPYRAVPGRWL
ncbi:hypothetical protein GCM10022245_15910 [Streptomyces mayteni]